MVLEVVLVVLEVVLQLLLLQLLLLQLLLLQLRVLLKLPSPLPGRGWGGSASGLGALKEPYSSSPSIEVPQRDSIGL